MPTGNPSHAGIIGKERRKIITVDISEIKKKRNASLHDSIP